MGIAIRRVGKKYFGIQYGFGVPSITPISKARAYRIAKKRHLKIKAAKRGKIREGI